MIVEDAGKERMIPEPVLRRRTRVFLLRHGEVEGHDRFRFHGHTDVRLTLRGRRQFEELAEFFRHIPIDSLYSSDLTRCRIGAEILANNRGLRPVALPALREMHLGILENLTYQEISERYPDLFQEWQQDMVHYRLPQGECLEEAAKRVIHAMENILETSEGKQILVVAHGGTNRIILSHALGLDLKHAFRIDQDYACINVIDYYPEWTVVKLMNGRVPSPARSEPAAAG